MRKQRLKAKGPPQTPMQGEALSDPLGDDALSDSLNGATPESAPIQLKSGPGQGSVGFAMSGVDMSDVKVHRNSTKPADLGALAYTQGSDVHLAPGQDRHLAHELGHVVQQKQGRVPVTTDFNGVKGNDDPALEAEADRLGQQAMIGSGEGRTRGAHSASDAPVQRMLDHAKNRTINSLADLNSYLAPMAATITNHPGAPLTSADFANAPTVVAIDAAIKDLDTKAHHNVDVAFLITEIDAKVVELIPFDANDCGTWTITVQECNGADTSQLQATWLTALQEGKLTDNSATGGAKLNQKYHAHTNGGSGGIAFRYTHVSKKDVTADVYDYATTRSDNKYHWRKAGSTSSGPP
jgi:hypothetical protein